MVSRAPGNSNEYYDPWLRDSVLAIKEHMNVKVDDWLTMILGPTGGGKSNLAMWMMDIYLKEQSNIKLCGLNRTSIAQAIKAAKDMPLPRMCWMDEANISKRDSLTKFNKDMIDLLLSVRGLQIFWIWCNPSLDYMDKHFIKERIKGFYYISSKMPGARPYYYFSRDAILQILNKYGDLTEKTIHRVRKKYASYRGWFKPYNGPLLKDYLDKKAFRMDEKVEEFFTNWGTVKNKEIITKRELKKFLSVGSATFARYEQKLIKQGILIENENFFIPPSGNKTYKNTVIDDFSNLARKGAERRGMRTDLIAKKEKEERENNNETIKTQPED